MPITNTESFKELRTLVQAMKDGGTTNIPFTKPDALNIFNAIIAIWEGTQYRNSVSNAIEGVVPGLTVAQKRRLHEAAMRIAIREGLL